MRLDAAGNKTGDHLYGGNSYDYAENLLGTADGGLLLGGYTNSPASGDVSQDGPAPWLLKLNAAGAIEWEKTCTDLRRDVDYLQAMSELPGGGYVLGGRSTQPASNTNPSDGDYVLTRLSATGTVQWSQSLGGPGNELLNTVLPLPGGGLLAVGTSDSDVGGDKTSASRGVADIWMLKVADTPLGVVTPLAGATLSLYPIPAGAALTVQADGLPQATQAELQVLNVLGQVAYHATVPTGGGSIRPQLAVESLPAGVYTLRLSLPGGVVARQFVKR